jgi:hypothetical protein
VRVNFGIFGKGRKGKTIGWGKIVEHGALDAFEFWWVLR